jgi:hypothetical protein
MRFGARYAVAEGRIARAIQKASRRVKHMHMVIADAVRGER